MSATATPKKHRREYISIDVDTQVDVYFDDVLPKIETEDLIAELNRRRKIVPVAFPGDEMELEEAVVAWSRGQTRECLIHLERALPRTFCGLADRVLGTCR